MNFTTYKSVVKFNNETQLSHSETYLPHNETYLSTMKLN